MDHFSKYPLRTQKYADYDLFKQVLVLINSKAHLTCDGLQEIVNLRASLNKGLSPELSQAFPKTIPASRHLDMANKLENIEPY